MDNLETFIFPEGRIIIEEGAPASEAYLIESGKVVVTVEKNAKQIELAQLGENEIFGETALFQGEHYGATVTAIEETTLIKMTPDILNIKIQLCDPMIRALIKMMMDRQKRSNEALANKQTDKEAEKQTET